MPSLTISQECVTLILSSFVEEILIPEYTKSIQLFIIPCLANDPEFPFPYLLQFFNDLMMQDAINTATFVSVQQNSEFSALSESSNPVSQKNSKFIEKVFDSPFTFHSFLTLDRLYLELIKRNITWIRNYINVLGYLSENIRKLPQRSSHSLFKQYDVEIEADDDIDSEEETDHKTESISCTERDCLIEAITFLNDEKRVDLILDNIENNLEDVQVLHSLCKICHNLMLYHRTALFEFR